jgi:hypothetical protein
LPDVPLHHQRDQPGDHQDRPERAEDVADGISHGLGEVRRQSELRDGVASGSDDRRLGQSTGGKAGRHPAVQAEHPGGAEHAEQAGQAHHEGGDQLVQRAAVQGVEELRATLEADGVDEEREEDVLDAAVDADAELADDHADQQRAGDAAQDEAADPDLADEVADRDRRKKRKQRLRFEKTV